MGGTYSALTLAPWAVAGMRIPSPYASAPAAGAFLGFGYLIELSAAYYILICCGMIETFGDFPNHCRIFGFEVPMAVVEVECNVPS